MALGHAAASAVTRTGVAGQYQKNMGFVPEIWSGRTLKSLDDKSVFLANVNRDYEGEIKGKGDTVRIHMVGNIQAKEYALGADRATATSAANAAHQNITYQIATGASTLLSIDAADYFAYEVEDIEAAQANPKYVAQLAGRAGLALAQATDRYILNKLLTGSAAAADDFGQVGAGHVHFADVATAGMFYDGLVDVGITLDDNLCPDDGRIVVVPTFLLGNMFKDTRFVGAGAAGAQGVRDKGYVGTMAGFKIYTLSRKTFQDYAAGLANTQVIDEASGTTARHSASGAYVNGSGVNDTYKGIAFVKDAFTFADQISKTENIRLEGTFADAVRGLHVYGGKVLRPQWCVGLEIEDHDIDTTGTTNPEA
jgi:hypothetical protein